MLHLCACVCPYVCVSMCVCVRVSTCLLLCIYRYEYVCLCVYGSVVSVKVCVCVCTMLPNPVYLNFQMTKKPLRLHWESYYDSEPVSISSVWVLLGRNAAFPQCASRARLTHVPARPEPHPPSLPLFPALCLSSGFDLCIVCCGAQPLPPPPCLLWSL